MSAQEMPSCFILRTVSSSSAVHLPPDDFAAEREALGSRLRLFGCDTDLSACGWHESGVHSNCN
jgi:hypothetical protein